MSLAHSQIADRVYYMVAVTTGVKREKLNAATRLDADLQIAGDDVVELLDMFAREFHVDVSKLYEKFDQYFYPENSASSIGIIFVAIIAIVPVLLSSKLLHIHVNSFLFVLLTICSVMTVLLVLGKLARRYSKRPGFKQITIGDLITAAEKGRLELNQ